MSKDKTLDQISEEIAEQLRGIARRADVSMNDIYNLVFRQYKTDNALRTEANKNAQLSIEEKRIQLEGVKFLIESHYAHKRLRKIQRRQKRSVWLNKHIFSLIQKKKSIPIQPVNKNSL